MFDLLRELFDHKLVYLFRKLIVALASAHECVQPSSWRAKLFIRFTKPRYCVKCNAKDLGRKMCEC